MKLAGLCIGLLDISNPTVGPMATLSGTLDRSRWLLTRIIDQAPAVLWTTDLDLRITSRSGAGVRSLDVLPELVAGVALLDLRAHSSAGEESISAHRRALTGESVAYLIRHHDWCYDAHVEPLRNDADAIVGVVGVAVDVSVRERALEDARHSRQELQDFFEYVPVGVHWAAADGTILRANQAELDLLGYERDEYVGRNIADFHVDRAIAQQCLQRLADGETLDNSAGGPS